MGTRGLYNSSSPSSSGGASGLAPVERPRAYSSASSSTLTAGSDTLNRSGKRFKGKYSSNVLTAARSLPEIC